MSLQTRSFIFVYNFFMQARSTIQPQMMNDFVCQSFIQQGLQLEDIASDLGIHGEIKPVETYQIAAIPKGKGRPKGEKNCKDRQRKPKTVINEENHRRGHWSMEENKRYHWFLQIYNKHFICKQMRRLDKIFKTMAVFIGSRQAQQCRSHHQKMEKKYHSFSSIILYLRKFHYGTEDERMVEEDIRAHEIKEQFNLINCRELQDLQMIKETPTVPHLQEEAKINFQCIEPPKQFQFQQNWLDLLGEDYEHRFQFDNFLH